MIWIQGNRIAGLKGVGIFMTLDASWQEALQWSHNMIPKMAET